MRILRKLIMLIALSVAINASVTGQIAFIQNIINQISGDSIFKDIAKLQKLDRYTTDNDQKCSGFLKSYIERFNYDTIYFHEYQLGSLPNIVAIKYGTKYPDSVMVIGAHYDSYAPNAPGADDNASGTSGLMEITRVLSKFEFEKTVILVYFSGEELGMLGSKAYVDFLKRNNIKVSNMINMDMIAYLRPGDKTNVSICINSTSVKLKNRYVSSSTEYVTGLSYITDSSSMLVGSSDHYSFWESKIPAISLIEESDFFSNNFNHNIHTSYDTLGLSANSKKMAELITKSTVATLIDFVNLDSSMFNGVGEIENLNQIHIYPNPVKDYVYVKSDNRISGNREIEIYNSVGQKLVLINTRNGENVIDMSKFSSGIYFIRYSDEKINKISKIIKE